MVTRPGNVIYGLCCTAGVCFVILGVIAFGVEFFKDTGGILDALGPCAVMFFLAFVCWVVGRVIRNVLAGR